MAYTSSTPSARLSTEEHTSSSRRPSWSKAGALIASAAFGIGAGAPAQASELTTETPSDPAPRVRSANGSIRPWKSTESVFVTASRVSAVTRSVVRPGGAQAPGVAVSAPTFTFAIPAGSLASALKEFQAQTGLAVDLSPDIPANLTTEGARGVLTAAVALDRLLDGSGLSHRLANGVVSVGVRLSDAVDVVASTPRVESAKYAGTLVETPQTIQVIPRSLIEEQGATTLSEALRNVPGITLQAGEGGGASNTSGDMFNMRGFSAANSLFVDGVRDDGLIARDVFNLEQIEVFSGPTGSDVGRSNAAGYVNLATKTPGVVAARGASFVYGSGTNVRATVDVNQPLSIGERGSFFGSAAVRINALWQEGGTAGRDHVNRENRSVASSVGFGIGTPTRVTVAGQVTRQDNLADYGLPAAASPVGTFQSVGVLAASPVDQSNYYGSPDFDYDRVRQDSVTLRAERDVNRSLTVRNQTRYSVTDREAVVTSIANVAAYVPATNLVTLSRQANRRRNDILSNQTSVVTRFGTGRIRHEASLGIEVATENYSAPGLAGVGTRTAIDLSHPDVFSPVFDMNLVPSGATADGESDTVAFYAFDAVDLTSRLRLTGGVRAEAYETRSHAVTVAGVVTDLTGEGTLTSGKVGALYRVNELGNVYLSYGSSLTPPGSSNFQLNANAANQNNPNVRPQQSVNLEAGSKWDLAGGRLQLTGALFRTENTNVIFVVDATAVPPVFNHDDGQLVRGASIAVTGRPTALWDVQLSLQYLDSETRSQNAATDGRRLLLTPSRSGSLWTTYRFPKNVRVGGGVQFADRVFVNAANTISLPAYALADILVEVPAGPRLLLRLNVSNLFDKVYVRSVNNNGGRYNPGSPRAFLVTSTLTF